MAVDEHTPAADIVKARDEVDDGRLPRSCGPQKSDHLARVRREAHLSKHRLPAVVAAPHLIEHDLATNGGYRGDRIGAIQHLDRRVEDLEDPLASGEGAGALSDQEAEAPGRAARSAANRY